MQEYTNRITESAVKWDIGLYVERSTTDEEKFNILTNVWSPNQNYQFPPTVQAGRQRRFQHEYLDQFKPWLCWSDYKKGAFCSVCVLFAGEYAGKGSHEKLQIFVNKPFNKYKDAKQDFKKHKEHTYHKHNSSRAENFLLSYSGKCVDVTQQLHTGWNNQIRENRKRLIPIIETVHFCGRQGISLRAHRDSGPLSLEEPPSNDGNFRAALRFKLLAGDDNLRAHITTCGRNASYLSWKIQNDIISTTGRLIRLSIIADVNNAHCFSVLSDATTDVSIKEQMCIVLRYVKDGNIHEDFVGFNDLQESTGRAIANNIMRTLTEFGLDLRKLRGQGYDGCATMRGHNNGVQACVRESYPLAVYTHCASHVLNLVIVHASKFQDIANCVATIKEITNFIRGSAKRMNKMNEILENGHITLGKLCETRWVELHESLINFQSLYPIVQDVLEDISQWPDNTASGKATQFLAAMIRPHFVISLCICSRFSGLLRPISKSLQDPTQDLIQCIKQIEVIETVLRDCREDCIIDFKTIFEKAESLNGEHLRIPRKVGRQTKRSNYETDDPETFYRQSIYIPYLDGLLTQMKERFNDHMKTVTKVQYLIPRYVSEATYDDIVRLVDFYSTDINVTDMKDEFKRWKIFWSNESKDELPATAIDAIRYSKSIQLYYPNICILLHILATLPVTTASAERSFSCLRRLKTYLRSTMCEARLSGLALMSIYRGKLPSTDKVVDELAKCNRKLLLS